VWKGKTVSVVFSTYREKASIRAAIEDYFSTGIVDEIVVVNNNAEPGTDEEVEGTGARLVHERRQGYGWGYRRGIAEATGDYVVLSEPDGTFSGQDVERFLVFAQDFPVVLGSRTNQSTILDDAEMGLSRKFFNVLVAKVLEVLFWTNALTEVGCTCKCFHRDVLRDLSRYWRTHDALFATELLLLVVSRRIQFVEIPISFGSRIGTSSLTAKWTDLAFWGSRIFLFILRFWRQWLGQARHMPPIRSLPETTDLAS
jgi:glycosyltransferase involved in cell wall biosynthesis